jgi:excisionase family DNA binding protein
MMEAMSVTEQITSGMFETQEFFTVDQVANVMQMTPRTIRNFIKSGKLRAAKFGGEWRIRKDDLNVFWKAHYPEPEEVEEMNNSVKAFLDGNHMEIEGPVQICTIVDLYEEDEEEAEKTRDRVWDVVNSPESNISTFQGHWRYIKEEKKGRFWLWTNKPETIRRLLAPLSKE